MSEIKGTYPASEQGNFNVIDTIGVPHPYCITPKHLQHCDSMYLDAETIKRAEGKGAKCDICRVRVKKGLQPTILAYDEHKEALLVGCKVDIKPAPDELKNWLLSIKAETERNKYEGWAFKRL